MSYKTDGILNFNELTLPENWKGYDKFFPVIECVEKIPCNPCSFSCPQKAITVDGDITNIPVVDFDKCTSCSICVGKCPGLAIFLVNPNFSEEKGAVMLPYEFCPLPEKGQSVSMLNRSGEKIGEGKIEKIVKSVAFENTPIVTVSMDKSLVMEARHIKL